MDELERLKVMANLRMMERDSWIAECDRLEKENRRLRQENRELEDMYKVLAAEVLALAAEKREELLQ